ncbi:OmpH family outer membrane protein [Sphingomonas qilianensis]|uniref:OmpH family outer membrane protein n=1 Tax=Sphingomonas qilianensis TaxID=1736690 RepID=A0ABU9XM90_9SPHN
MNTYKKILLATVLAAPATLIAASANAQATNVAIADPDAAIANSKVWAAAQTEIGTTYKPQLDQAKARSEAIAAELQPLYKKLDGNGDNQLNQQEIDAARTARRPEIAQIEAKEKAGQEEIGRMTVQASRARAYAAEQVAGKVNDAVTNVVKARRITLLIRPNAAYFADPAADITPAISTEIDRLIPKVSITPPANWQPGQQRAAAAPGTPAPAAPKAAERPR